jgi:hypothetical protein
MRELSDGRTWLPQMLDGLHESVLIDELDAARRRPADESEEKRKGVRS